MHNGANDDSIIEDYYKSGLTTQLSLKIAKQETDVIDTRYASEINDAPERERAEPEPRATG